MTSSPWIAVVGSINLDLRTEVERLPTPGETVLARRSIYGQGGKGANQAIAARQLGGSVAMVGAIGDDEAGATAFLDLERHGVDVSRIKKTADIPTGRASVIVDCCGENLIVVDPGANAAISENDVVCNTVRDARVLLLQLELPVPTITAAASTSSGLVILNPAPCVPVPPELRDRVDVLVPNIHELMAMTGTQTIDNLHHVARLASDLASDGTTIVVTLGADGALIVTLGAPAVHVAPPQVPARDTTGAGDCFCGALAVAMSTRDEIVAATRFAVAAATLSTTGLGARGRLPTRADVDVVLPHVQHSALSEA